MVGSIGDTKVETYTHSPHQGLLNNLHTEAETIQSLVSAVSTPPQDRSLASPDVATLQSSWSAEKQALLEAVQSLKNLVAQTRKASTVISAVLEDKNCIPTSLGHRLAFVYFLELRSYDN